MVYECIRVVITALAGDHGVQLVHHGQQQLQLVSWLLQMDEHKLAQHRLPNLQRTAGEPSQQTRTDTRAAVTTTGEPTGKSTAHAS